MGFDCINSLSLPFCFLYSILCFALNLFFFFLYRDAILTQLKDPIINSNFDSKQKEKKVTQ